MMVYIVNVPNMLALTAPVLQRAGIQVINLATKKNIFASIFNAEETTTNLHFAEISSSLMQKLGELLKKPVKLAPKRCQTRDLTAPPADEVPIPLSAATGQTLLKTVWELVRLAQKQTVKMGF